MASADDGRGIREDVGAVLRAEADAIAALEGRLDWASVSQVVKLLLGLKGHVYAMGCGTSGVAAKKIAHTFSCVGYPATYLSPADAPHGALGALNAGDVVFLVTKGGETSELSAILPALSQLGATVIAVTGVADSTIGRGADLRLIVEVDSEPDPHNMLATSSTLAVAALMDAIAIALMRRNGFDPSWFGVVHPGGAVGHRLNGRISGEQEH